MPFMSAVTSSLDQVSGSSGEWHGFGLGTVPVRSRPTSPSRQACLWRHRIAARMDRTDLAWFDDFVSM